MNILPLLSARLEEIDPEAIVHVTTTRPDTGVLHSWEGTRLTGRFFRVFPKTGRDVLFLQSLEKYVWKWAPLHGDGILVHESRLPQQQA